MWFPKIHSFRQPVFPFFFSLISGLSLPTAILNAAPPDVRTGLTYTGWPGMDNRAAAWARAASPSASDPEETRRTEPSPGMDGFLSFPVNQEWLWSFTGEERQQSQDGPAVFAPSSSLVGPWLECFAGSRDTPGKNPIFFSDPALPGSGASGGLNGLPRGRRASLLFLRIGNNAALPGIWSARSLSGPGIYVNMSGLFLAWHPLGRVWGAQVRSGSLSRFFYLGDFEGTRKQVNGFAILRMYDQKVDPEKTGSQIEISHQVLAVDLERSADWDGFHYRDAVNGDPFRPYRSWSASVVAEIPGLRTQLAGQDRGDAAFRVFSLERSRPVADGWYFWPVLRQHRLRLYRENLTRDETMIGPGAARIQGQGSIRFVILAGAARSLAMEVMSGMKIRAMSFEIGVVLAGSENRDFFVFLPVYEVGEGRSRFFDRAAQVAVLRAMVPGFEVSLQYAVRRMDSGELRQLGYLRAAFSKQF